MDINFDYSLFDGSKAYKVDMSILKSEISKLEEIVVLERGKEDVDLEDLKVLVGNLVKLRIIKDWRNGYYRRSVYRHIYAMCRSLFTL